MRWEEEGSSVRIGIGSGVGIWSRHTEFSTVIDMLARSYEKISFLFLVLYFFLAKTELATENTGTETRSDYAEVRKRTNTDVEPERITRSNILEYTLTKPQNNIYVRIY